MLGLCSSARSVPSLTGWWLPKAFGTSGFVEWLRSFLDRMNITGYKTTV
ncbi:MAG: hypothetical protein QME51_10995 [Planctomycetota bacterium]|nr:hypothetical protein [Planctomycetota bacterium]